MLGNARDETLEERKQRITRKYLRERAAVTQSDLTVPTDMLEDERVTESEKFAETMVDLDRQESAAAPIMPPPPTVPVPRTDANWLLDGADEITDFDAYGNPVESSIDSGGDLWSAWGTETESREQQRSESRRYDPYSREERGIYGNRDERSIRGTISGGPASAETRSDLFGRRQSQPTYTTGFGLQGDRRTYGPSPEQGLLNSTFGQRSSGTESDPVSTESERELNYTPYKSPYQQKKELQNQPTWSTSGSEQEQYKRSDSYEQWKTRKKAWDPTADDAYVDELMKQNRR